MTNMFIMNQRMTHRTQYLEIIYKIIFSIVILMMYTKNIFIFTITAYFTFFNQTAIHHAFSNCRKTRCEFFKIFFIYAISGAINSIFTRAGFKFFRAMFTLNYNTTFQPHSFIVTFPRAIFSFIASASNMMEFCITNFTNRLISNKLVNCFTFSRAIYSCIKSVFRYVKFFFTFQTFNEFSRSRFVHAII